jgi:hypothetical protein
MRCLFPVHSLKRDSRRTFDTVIADHDLSFLTTAYDSRVRRKSNFQLRNPKRNQIEAFAWGRNIVRVGHC